MPNDPGIAMYDPSSCLYIDAPKPSPYWLSPNVIMTTMSGDTSDVYPGSNTTQVTVSWKGDCAIPEQQENPDVFAVIFDLYIGDPFLGMAVPTLGALASAFPPPNGVAILPGQTVSTSVGPWDSSVIPHLSQPHHACLVARVYPFGATPDTGDLAGYPSSDPHYAQHNCTVNTIDGQGKFKLDITNGTAGKDPQLVAIQAVPDLNPNRTTLDAVMGSLKQIPSFKQIATTPLKGVEFDLGPFKGHEHESLLERIEHWIEKEILELIEALEGHSHKAGGVSARAVLPPNFFAKFTFSADVTGARSGDAHIYHVSQVNGKGQPYGGVTVVIVIN